MNEKKHILTDWDPLAMKKNIYIYHIKPSTVDSNLETSVTKARFFQ